MACSLETLLLEIAWFSRFCSFVSCPPLGFLCGKHEFVCSFFIPMNPVSVSTSVSSQIRISASVKSLKSCFFPLQKITQMTLRLFLHTITSVFIVWHFFFPEYHLFCSFLRFFIRFLFRCLFFLVALSVFRFRLSGLPHIPPKPTRLFPATVMSHLL